MGWLLPASVISASEIHEVLRRRAVATHRGQRREDDVLVVIDERPLQLGHRNWPEGEERRRAGRKLEVDLGGDLLGRLGIVGDGLADDRAVLALIHPPLAAM